MKPDFMEKTAKIITEVRTGTCIDELDTEVLEVLFDNLQEELNEYYNKVFTYARNIGYEDGSNDGYTAGEEAGYERGLHDGYDLGYDDGYANGHESCLDEVAATEEEATYSRGFEDGRVEAESDNEAYTKDAVEIAYGEGYSVGYYEGRSGCYADG